LFILLNLNNLQLRWLVAIKIQNRNLKTQRYNGLGLQLDVMKRRVSKVIISVVGKKDLCWRNCDRSWTQGEISSRRMYTV